MFVSMSGLETASVSVVGLNRPHFIPMVRFYHSDGMDGRMQRCLLFTPGAPVPVAVPVPVPVYRLTPEMPHPRFLILPMCKTEYIPLIVVVIYYKGKVSPQLTDG